MIQWVNFLHFYQPPTQSQEMIKIVTAQSYAPLLRILLQFPRARMTFNISGSIIEHLIQMQNKKIIEELKILLKRKQIELTSSACYHPILPLFPEKEIIRQVELNNIILKKTFGALYNPRGFYLPEMAYSRKVGKTIQSLGSQWIILDEIHRRGAIEIVDPQKKYRIQDTGLYVVFRSRLFSRSFAPHTLLREVNHEHSIHTFITATDAEMYGHHHKDENKELQRVLKHPSVQTHTISQFLKVLPKKSVGVDPVSASWESYPDELQKNIPYALWDNPRNITHKLLWELCAIAIETVNHNAHSSGFVWARQHLDRGLASCTWWWASEKKPDVFSPLTWHPSEIEKGMKELISSIRSLPNIKPTTKLRAEKVYQHLMKNIWNRHWKKHAAQELHNT